MTVPKPHGLVRRIVKLLGVFRLEIADAERTITEHAPTDAFRSEMAHAEGWDIFDGGVRDDGTPHVELQRVDSPPSGTPRIDTDHAAWEHLVGWAREVPALHVQALQLPDATERKLIQAFCYLVSGGDLSPLLREGVHPGDALMLLAAFVYAFYGVLLKRWNLPITGWQSTYMQALCALAIMFPAFLATPVTLRQLNAETLPLVGYAGGLASVVLPFLWIRGVQELGPNRCAVFMNLLPVLTAAAAIVMLGEPVRPFHVVGGGLTLAGVACAQAFRRPLRRRTVLLGE